MRIPLLILMLSVATAAQAAAVPFETLFRGARVLTRAADAGEGYGAYEYRLPGGRAFTVNYTLGLTLQGPPRLRRVAFDVQQGDPRVPALTSPQLNTAARVIADTALKCFNLLPSRRAGLIAWVQQVNARDASNDEQTFGPMKLTFERQQSSGLGYYVSTYTLSRASTPGTAPWTGYCTF
ncbi:hypothetical protein [Deinococcus maricopensis]|uniref:Uncharacterized protein n=1 Tax=Deinococcus maricopensis (strain DSM 21211 / LMG 22137 / NRRL B-23946 / LB-34) TaxID=709986 RepID=E8UA23_DEIML|nr:hypothetical protein [Deinococcus maricopensis]ADV67912.1 hypothetical protein Deima_2274 [Deinococcus maricopensis DSM 21211]